MASVPSSQVPSVPSSSQMFIKRLTKDTKLPTRQPGSVGYDLYSNISCSIPSKHQASIPTGISGTPPEGTYFQLFGRSGLAMNHGIGLLGGVIDPTYTGEFIILLVNNGLKTYDIKQGDKIAQMVVLKYDTPGIQEVYELVPTNRGDNGFGSSGK